MSQEKDNSGTDEGYRNDGRQIDESHRSGENARTPPEDTTPDQSPQPQHQPPSQNQPETDVPGAATVSFPGVPFSDQWSEEFRKEIEDSKIAGWEIDESFENRVVMVNRDWGSFGAHAILALLTFWWTLGIGNAIYAAYRHWGAADKKQLRDPMGRGR